MISTCEGSVVCSISFSKNAPTLLGLEMGVTFIGVFNNSPVLAKALQTFSPLDNRSERGFQSSTLKEFGYPRVWATLVGFQCSVIIPPLLPVRGWCLLLEGPPSHTLWGFPRLPQDSRNSLCWFSHILYSTLSLRSLSSLSLSFFSQLLHSLVCCSPQYDGLGFNSHLL